MTPHATYPTLPRGYVIRQVGSQLKVERTGLATAKERFIGYYDDIVSLPSLTVFGSNLATARAYRSASPFYPSLLVFSASVTSRGGLINGVLDIEYRGLDPALNQIPPPIYSLERSTQTEDISTHPLFKSQIAGTPDAPLNQAQFIDGADNLNPAPPSQTGTFDPNTATFKGWIWNADNPSPYIGVEDYLCPGSIWKATYVSYTPAADLSMIGKIDTPLGPVPAVDSGYNWLNTGLTFTDNAGLYRIEESWRLSGPKGWDPVIYS